MPAAPVIVQKEIIYVALGSSYAAGMESPIATGRWCLKSPDRYPRVIATELGGKFIDKTCSGAKTKHVLYGGAKNQKEAQVRGVDPNADIVSITIGSNDVQYMGRLAYLSCLKEGCPPSNWAPPVPDWEKLTEAISNVISDIRSRAPKARIVYIGYPKPISTACLPGTEPSGLTADQFYDTMVDAIKQGLGEAEYVDPVAFKDHDLCSATPWFVPRGEPAEFHPNSAGREALAAALDEHLEKDGVMTEKHDETHKFNGSSTAVAAFEAWFAGKEFVESPIQTRDIRNLTLPNGIVVKPGESVRKTDTGEFVIADVP